MESEEGRREGWNLPFHTRMDHDGVGDDSHRDDAGNFSDFLGRISLGVNQSGGKTVIAERLGVITRATLCRSDCLSDNISCSCVITSDGPLSCLVCILLF